MNKRKGFTLIELLVIIVIIGTLAGTGIYYFRGLFVRQRLEETMNNVRAFYQRTTRYATTTGENYRIELDRSNEFIRCLRDTTAVSTEDSVGLVPGLDLDFAGGDATITFTIKVSGIVEDNNNIRDFSIYDSDSKDSILFYISPLGEMEARIK